jgi:hypothetical protein
MSVDTKKAMRAAGAGLVATGIFLAALLILGGAVFLRLAFSPDANAWQTVVLAIMVTMVAVGGALPGRALGAGWVRAIAASGVAVAALALATPSLVSSGEGLFLLFYLFAFIAPAFITIAATVGKGLSIAGLVAIATVAALSFLVPQLAGWILLPGVSEVSSALVEGTAMVAVGWALLPALAGLFQRRYNGAR